MCSTFFTNEPNEEKFAVNVNADYVVFASKQGGTIHVYSLGKIVGTDTPVDTLTLINSGGNPSAPFKARRATTPKGYRLISDVPMGAWFNLTLIQVVLVMTKQ